MWLKKLSCFVVLKTVFCENDIHEFMKLSEDLQSNFDNFKIVSRQESKSEWCKVDMELFLSLINACDIQDVMEVEEIRDINGKHYRKMYLIDTEVDQRIVVDKNSGAELYLSKR